MRHHSSSEAKKASRSIGAILCSFLPLPEKVKGRLHLIGLRVCGAPSGTILELFWRISCQA